MGTRSGSLDPSVVTFIAEKEGLTASEMSDLLNKKSGLLGVSGVSSDDRDVTAAEKEGNPRAKLAHEMLYYQIAQYVGSFYVALGGCDAIVFTAGLSENQPALREAVCNYLECIGVELDKEANNNTIHGRQGTLTTPDSKIRVELIATDEEMVIARDTRDIVAAL
jgi:acetate kinase